VRRTDTSDPFQPIAMSRHRTILLAAAFAGACASEHENVVHVIAEQAPGLKKAARVQYRGVDVGFVKQVYFTPGGVRIDLLLQRNDVPIRAQDTVRISSVGAFGEQVVDIQPGLQSAPLIARGATLPKAQQDTTVSLPIGVWRSIVKTLGFTADSIARDSAKAAVAKPDSTAPAKP
jgi:phospholipid/cholesterol/gamma-HCH transport system substrate-binding protein